MKNTLKKVVQHIKEILYLFLINTFSIDLFLEPTYNISNQRIVFRLII